MWKRERERANYACNLYTENFNLTNIYLVLIMWQGLRFCGKVEESESVSCLVMSNSFGTPWTTAIRLLCPWSSPGKNIGVDCLLQGIFPTQGLNPGLLHCRKILYYLSLQGHGKYTHK